MIDWFNSNRLLLNTEKTEFLWCHSKKRRQSVPSTSLRIGSSWISPSSSVRCLGVILDSELSFERHITKCVSTCFGILRQIRSISSSIPRVLRKTLISALVISRLDYSLSVLYGVPAYHLKRLQSVLNAADRLIYDSKRSSAITPLLRDLHWLPIKQRIDYRLCILSFCCRHHSASEYLTSCLIDVNSEPGRSRLRSADSKTLVVPLSRRPTLGGRAFPVASARCWNSLPKELRSANSLSSFNKKTKDHFIKLSFY